MAVFFDPRTGQFVQVTPGGQKTNLKMQTNVATSQNPGQSGMTSGAGSAPPASTPVPSGGSGGSGTGGGGTVNTQGGNISQGAVYGGSVTNTASGGTGSLDASGGSNNVYRETTAAPSASPTPSAATPPGAECGMDKPCPEGKFCKMGVCEPIPDNANPNPDEGDVGDMKSFSEFLKSKGAM